MYDIHTHLYWKIYDADRDEVIRRAVSAGVEKMLVIGTTIEESRQAVELAEKYPELFASVGIHPHFFNDLIEKEFQNPNFKLQNKIETLKQELKNRTLSSKKIVAIGECGLDYYSHDKQSTINNQQKAAQKEGFLAQVDLAQELNLPLIVHCRSSSPTADDAYRDLLSVLKAISYNLKAIVLHCYMGDTEVTREFLKLSNVYFSFAGNITYPVKQEVRGTKDDLTETVKLVSLERLFFETDCPFLAPQKHRGKRNEPMYVTEITKIIAELKGVTIEQVSEATTSSAERVFGL